MSRILKTETISNMRSMAGYQNKDGKVMKDMLFRSGHPCKMSAHDKSLLSEKSIKRIIDFRSVSELDKRPFNTSDHPEFAYRSIPIGGNAAAWMHKVFEELRNAEFPAKELHNQLVEAFQTIPVANAGELKQFFAHLIDNDGHEATLYHCTAGKDRTGIATALILEMLNFDRELIMEDFMLTNEAVHMDDKTREIAKSIEKASGIVVDHKVLLPMAGVREDFLHSMYSSIDENFGSMENYIENTLGVSPVHRETLQAIYLA